MWCIKLSLLVLLSHFTAGSNFTLEVYNSDFLKMYTPEDLGQHLLKQLARNESRFISRQCFGHLLEYAEGLVTLKLWAIKMFDATAKIPTGILRGHGGALGSFTECLNVKGKKGTIHGKYCLGKLSLIRWKPKTMNNFAESDLTLQNADERIIDLVEKSVGLPWGVCIPDACSAQDLRFLHLYLLEFSDEQCQTKRSQSREMDSADVGAVVFLGVITALVLASTIYDIFIFYTQNEKGRGSVLLRSFSVITNGSDIITIKKTKGEISCIHGIRALNLLLLTAAYRFGLHLFAPLNNWLDMANWIIDNGNYFEVIIVLDTFFVLSGTLISYNYLRNKVEGIRFNLFTYYLNRIVRLTPALAVLVLLHATLLRHMGSGPVWPRARDSLLVDNCRKYWWSSLLYVQNYVSPSLTQICLIPTWQLSVEMQLFILSPLTLIPLTRAPKFTLGFVACCLFSAILSPFLAAYVYKLKSVLFTFRSLRDLRNYVQYFFLPTHTRASPWLIGIILGYIIFETSKEKSRIRMKKGFLAITAIFLWVVSLGLIIMCVAIGSKLRGVKYNWITHAFHMALVRPAWSIAISWIIFACVHGYGGPVNSILSAGLLRVISRISYCTYLVNFSLMFFLTNQTQIGLEFSNFNAFYKFCGDVILCLALGFLWSLAFESPFITIAKVAFGKLRS